MHLEGKLHQGYLKIREKLQELRAKRVEDRRQGLDRIIPANINCPNCSLLDRLNHIQRYFLNKIINHKFADVVASVNISSSSIESNTANGSGECGEIADLVAGVNLPNDQLFIR